MIRKVASGNIHMASIGLKVLRKIENIVREEMDQSGAQEVLNAHGTTKRIMGRNNSAGRKWVQNY